MISENHRRKPGFHEKYFLCRNVEGYYSNFNVVGQFNRHISRARLSQALSSLILKKPSLLYNYFRVGLSQVPNYIEDFELRCVDSIRFGDVVEYRQIDRFDESTFEVINTFKNPTGNANAPLWKLCIFETSDSQYVCGYFCHSLADGGTALEFQNDLVKELAAVEDDAEYLDKLFDYERDSCRVPKVAAPIEEQTDLYIPDLALKAKLLVQHYAPRLLRLLAAVYQRLILPFKKEQSSVPIFRSEVVKKDLLTKFKVINFPPSEVSKITAFCRSKDITLTPFFNIVGLHCIEKAIYPHFGNKFSSLNLIAINGRRYYPSHSNPFAYGTMVCGAPTVFHPLHETDEGLVRDMQELHEMIQSQITSKRSFKDVWLHKWNDILRVLASKLGIMDRFTTMISNLGKVKDDPQSSWKLVNAWFGLNTSTGYHFILNMVSTQTGGLNLVVPYHPMYAQLSNEKVPAMDDFVYTFKDTCNRLTGTTL